MSQIFFVEYIEHPLIKEKTVEARVYQQIIVARALERGNTLVVAPTALGKTIMAALLSAEVLRRKGGKILFLAPTKPLAEQHAETFKKVLKIPEDKINVLTGAIPPEKRAEIWKKSTVICATPQVIENDLISGRIDLEEVSLLIVDEAHRAVGNYPYVFIAREFLKKDGLIFAITASPGSTEEKIGEICSNLGIKNVEVKTPKDPDVRDYIKGFEMEWVKVELPEEFKIVKRILEQYMRKKLRVLKEMGVVASSDIHAYSKKDYLALQKKISEEVFANGNKELGDALLNVVCIIKAYHALEVLETQGFPALAKYLERLFLRKLQPRPPKSLLVFTSEEEILKVKAIAEEAVRKGIIHPKVGKLREILADFFKKNPRGRAIVFVQYRDTASFLVNVLKDVCMPVRFVGQARRGEKGMTQKEQKKVLEEFREGKYNVLVATSVAEEGLDIPDVDLVVFYEAVPSEIRFIQRRGRTGRFRKGRVIFLLAKGTRDETYYWVSRAKERKMLEILERLKKIVEKTEQRTILDYTGEKTEKITVIADHREIFSPVIKELKADPEVIVTLKSLPVGDYVVSDRVCIERKTKTDFANSIIDGRLFEQAKMISEYYSRPVLIVEKDEHPGRNVHPNAIAGALASLIIDYGFSVLFSNGPKETATLVKLIAKREQVKEKKTPRVRGEKRVLSLPEMQRFIVESLPFVGPKTAIELLRRFGSVENVFTASERELAEVEGIGPKKAKEIRKVITEEYRDEL